MYEIDSYFIQPTREGYKMFLIYGHNVMYTVECETENPLKKAGDMAIKGNCEWMDIEGIEVTQEC